MAATNFVAREYIEALQTLVNRHDVAITVQGFTQNRDYAKLSSGPIAEFQIDSFPTEPTGDPRELDGLLTAGLLVMVQLDESDSEEKAFELALDVATALVDDVEYGQEPVMKAGPIKVTGIEPETPDGALVHRVASFLVTYEQAWRIKRTSVVAEPTPPARLYLGRSPDIGEGHVDDYTLIAGEEP